VHVGVMRESIAKGEVLAALGDAEVNAVGLILGCIRFGDGKSIGVALPKVLALAQVRMASVAYTQGIVLDYRFVAPVRGDRKRLAVLEHFGDLDSGAKLVEAETLDQVGQCTPRAIEKIAAEVRERRRALRRIDQQKIEQDLSLRREQGP